MAEKENATGFSHIKVGGDFEDDDVVIVAGSRAAQAAAQVESKHEEAPAATSEDAVEHVAAEDLAVDDMPEYEPERVEPQPDARPDSPSKKDGYRETTLEDLESSSMPTTQKIVIIIAVVLIVIAIAWYFLH